MRYVVGLTGGIGAGKTAVANLFAGLGTGVVDTDEIAHMLTAPGQPAVAEIARRFGTRYLTADHALDRTRMRELVFADDEARRDLEGILHPLIRRESERLIAAAGEPYVILVVPLLFETGSSRTLVRRVLVVDCDPELQIARVMRRSSWSRQQVQAIMNSQVSRAERLRGADDVISNDGDLTALAAQVAELHRKYVDTARGQ